MKVALAQIDSTVGDLKGNLVRIRAACARAESKGAELVVFPEQALAGYPALDLWEDPAFVRANAVALRELARGTGRMGILIGFVEENKRRSGKPVFNSAALLHRGRVAAVRRKSLLPTYDVFDEARYFEPADSNRPIAFKGLKLGVTICEDAWAPERAGGRRLYRQDPMRRQAEAGADLLINLSASPFIRGKSQVRQRLLSAHARRARRPLLYCNLVGGNDELVFDGASLVFDGRGRPVARGRLCEEDLLLVDTERLPAPLPSPVFPEDIEEVEAALTLGLRDYVRKCGFEKVFIGLSGGIDSAVVCALAVRALGAAAVTGVTMPSMYSSKGSLTDARALAANLGVRLLDLPIEPLFRGYQKTLKATFASVAGSRRMQGVAEQNLQSRIRGTLLMALSNKEGGIVLTTGNKSELSVGYCTLYGDMSGGLAVLADVPKKTVYELARRLNRDGRLIPEASIRKAPSAELKPGQKDQDDLPAYDVVDGVLTAYIEERADAAQIIARGYPRKVVHDLLARIDRNEYKRRQAAPSLKISPKAFGVGRRMPIARGSYR